MPVNLPTLTTQVLHFIVHYFTLYLFSILSHTFTLFNHFCAFYVGFMLFLMFLYFITSQGFSFYTSTILLWHAVSHSYNMMVSFAFFAFVRHTAHCFLLLESCMLHMVKKHCPEEAQLNRWVKRRLIIKIARRANLSASFVFQVLLPALDWFCMISWTSFLSYMQTCVNNLQHTLVPTENYFASHTPRSCFQHNVAWLVVDCSCNLSS